MDAFPSARLALHGGGWVGYTGLGRRYATAIHLSFKPGPGRWVVDGVWFADFRVTARNLRDLPLGQVEAWVNQLAQQGLHELIGLELSDPVQLELPDPVQEFAVEGQAVLVDKLPDAPSKGAKPEAFYREVARIYARAALASPRPAAEMAEGWGVPLTSVHRWVRVARERGHLPPTEKGRKA
jgi:hypothetical protein